jgi:hypothetical protein
MVPPVYLIAVSAKADFFAKITPLSPSRAPKSLLKSRFYAAKLGAGVPMRDHFNVSTTLDAQIAEEADFFGDMKKEYKIVFNIFDHQGNSRKYTVIVNRRHLTSAGYGNFGDSKKAAIEFAKFIVKRRFNLNLPNENAAICRGKICRFVRLPE